MNCRYKQNKESASDRDDVHSQGLNSSVITVLTGIPSSGVRDNVLLENVFVELGSTQ